MIEELKERIYGYDKDGKPAVAGPPTLEDVIDKVNEIIRYLNEREGNHFREPTKMIDDRLADPDKAMGILIILTWDDIANIDVYISDVEYDFQQAGRRLGDDAFYQEVFKRFADEKKGLLRSFWAPTEEQMTALYDILHPADTVNRLALESLYEQLKQLETGRKEIIREGCMGIKGPSCDSGRRGRMGGVPKEISKEAEAFQAKFPGPYDEDDIITAYETAKMKAIEALPKWKEVKTCGKGECTIGSAFEATGRRYPILYCYGYGISIEQLFEKLPKKED